jgi:RimJ/RimL family protein N-acetyltransferase
MRHDLPVPVTCLDPHDWRILRDLRLASLEDSERWFASTAQAESLDSDVAWAERAAQLWGILTVDGVPCGLVRISEVDDDRPSDCWVTAWWIHPDHRGRGHARIMQNWLDDVSRDHHWAVQGLGVWPENDRAIAAYEGLGYRRHGEPKPSTRRVGQLYQEMLRTVPPRPGGHDG